MANELIHATVGTTMTQAEFEAIGLHVLNSQAIGDLIYASSATQLSRLGIGSSGNVLVVSGGLPVWQSTGVTLTSPTINGTIATTGLTMPAFTLGANVVGNSKSITGLGGLILNASTSIPTIPLVLCSERPGWRHWRAFRRRGRRRRPRSGSSTSTRPGPRRITSTSR